MVNFQFAAKENSNGIELSVSFKRSFVCYGLDSKLRYSDISNNRAREREGSKRSFCAKTTAQKYADRGLEEEE